MMWSEVGGGGSVVRVIFGLFASMVVLAFLIDTFGAGVVMPIVIGVAILGLALFLLADGLAAIWNFFDRR